MTKKSIVSHFKENFLGRPCPKDVNTYVSNEIARIAVEELKKNPDYRRCPYEEFKELNPDITLFLNAHKIFYSLSVEDLYAMKVRVDFENEEYDNAIDHYYEGGVENPVIRDLNLSTLGLTSLEGIESVGLLDSIVDLDVSNNQLTTIESIVFNLLNLRSLNISYNYLGENLTLDSLIFSQFEHLERLNLIGNTSKKYYSQDNFFDSDDSYDSDDNDLFSDEDGYNPKRLCFSKSPSISNSENDDFSGIKDEDVL